MTDRSNTLVNASLIMQSTLDLHFVVWLKNAWFKNVWLKNGTHRYRALCNTVLQHY